MFFSTAGGGFLIKLRDCREKEVQACKSRVYCGRAVILGRRWHLGDLSGVERAQDSTALWAH